VDRRPRLVPPAAAVGAPLVHLRPSWPRQRGQPVPVREHYCLIPSINVEYFVARRHLDAHAPLTALLSFLAVIGSWGSTKDPGYHGPLLLLETGMMGTFIALDFFLFYVFWEVMLLRLLSSASGRTAEGVRRSILLYTWRARSDADRAAGPLLHTTNPETDHTYLLTTFPEQHTLAERVRRPHPPVSPVIGFAIKVPLFRSTRGPPMPTSSPPISVSWGHLLKMGTYG